MKFKVEGTFTVDGTAFVIARRGDDGNFSLSSSSRLDGAPLQQFLEIPRKLLRPELGLDMNVFAFALKDQTDLPRFQKYDVVELNTMMTRVPNPHMHRTQR